MLNEVRKMNTKEKVFKALKNLKNTDSKPRKNHNVVNKREPGKKTPRHNNEEKSNFKWKS